MGMTINQSWSQVIALQIDNLLRLLISTYASNPAIMNSDVALFSLPDKAVYNARIS